MTEFGQTPQDPDWRPHPEVPVPAGDFSAPIEPSNPLIEAAQRMIDDTASSEESRFVATEAIRLLHGFVEVNRTNDVLAHQNSILQNRNDRLRAINDQQETTIGEQTLGLADLRKQLRDVEAEAGIDKLTGLYNRHSLHTQAAKHSIEVDDDPTGQKVLVMVFADLDNLTKINKVFGHMGGDQVIKRAASILQAWAGPLDAARFGGDEMTVFGAVPPSELPSEAALKIRINSEITRLAQGLPVHTRRQRRAARKLIPKMGVSVGMVTLNQAEIRNEISQVEQDGRELKQLLDLNDSNVSLPEDLSSEIMARIERRNRKYAAQAGLRQLYPYQKDIGGVDIRKYIGRIDDDQELSIANHVALDRGIIRVYARAGQVMMNEKASTKRRKRWGIDGPSRSNRPASRSSV